MLEQGRGIKRSKQHGAAVQRVSAFSSARIPCFGGRGSSDTTPPAEMKRFGRPARKGSGDPGLDARRRDARGLRAAGKLRRSNMASASQAKPGHCRTELSSQSPSY